MPKAHKSKDSDKVRFHCEDCGISLSSSYNLKAHRESFCGRIKKFICTICNSKFLTNYSLIVHRKLHEGKKNFVCTFCGNSFLSKGQLIVHTRKHTKEKPFICGQCGKGFSHRESLVTHSTLHSGIKPYLCEFCKATFSCIGNLIKHRQKRPDTCGLPIYSNKKVFKRAGVKCKGDVPKIIVQEVPIEEFKLEEVMVVDESNVQDTTIFEELNQETIIQPMTAIPDHQYSQRDETDFSKKESEVFEYIGYEIRSIEEQEKLQDEAVSELMEDDSEIISIIEDTIDDQNQIIEEETIVIEQLDIIESTECQEEEEFKNFVETSNGEYQCKFCPKIYQKKNMTIKHLRSEHEIFITNYNYNDSNRYRKPQKDSNWICAYCPKKFTSKRLAEKHQAVHGPVGDLLFKCNCCSLYFKTQDEQETHQYSEHMDRLQCKVGDCMKLFDHPEKVRHHTKYAHGKKKTSLKKYVFVCELCGRNFSTRVALSDHERSSCGKDPIYRCNLCDKYYHSSGSLKCHMTIHTNSLDFECFFCHKRFRTKGQVTVHQRSHTKEKNFKCSNCPASFSHRESLLTHVTLHTKIKRFECSNCELRFSCISNLISHKKSHKEICGNSEIKKVSDATRSVKMVKPDPVFE